MANYDDNAFCIVSIFATMLRKTTFAYFYSAKVKTMVLKQKGPVNFVYFLLHKT